MARISSIPIAAMSGYSTTQAAKKVGVSKRTLLEWVYRGLLKEPTKLEVMGTIWRIWKKDDVSRARKIKGTMKRGPKPKKRK
jgi:DNA-binding transcriptional MerR regulator